MIKISTYYQKHQKHPVLPGPVIPKIDVVKIELPKIPQHHQHFILLYPNHFTCICCGEYSNLENKTEFMFEHQKCFTLFKFSILKGQLYIKGQKFTLKK